MGDAPDIYKLSKNIVDGYSIREQQQVTISTENVPVMSSLSTSDAHVIHVGEQSVRPLLEFHDKHVNCDTTMEYVDYVPPKRSVPNRVIPMKRRITEVLALDCVDQDVDLLDLTMLLQRHTCKPGGCLKQYGDRPVTCRFKMPKIKSNVTRPTFKRALLNGRPVGPWQITLEPFTKNKRSTD